MPLFKWNVILKLHLKLHGDATEPILIKYDHRVLLYDDKNIFFLFENW